MQDLNSLIPAGSGWVLNDAYGINERGQIVGDGTINGQSLAFLLTPATMATVSALGRIDLSAGGSPLLVGVWEVTPDGSEPGG
jgi:probable HAF family extracellular repeat protein